jgi:2-polyprenyl-3-methyl-5-hydroxy-6-metoxy-1,4-benzoquinol methylase
MNCIACGKKLDNAENLSVQGDIFTDRKYSVKICECGLGTTEITEDSLAQEINDATYNDISWRIDIYSHNLRGHFKARYKNIMKSIMAQEPPGRKVLEIGSNVGYTLNLIKNQNFDVIGCELNDKCREVSKLLWNIPVERDFFEINEKFDVIIICDVLEHLPDPVSALKKIYSLLNKNGLLFIQVPNIASRKCRKLKEKWNLWCVPDHRFHFTPSSISALLNKNNFSVEFLNVIVMLSESPLLKIRPRRFIFPLLRILDSFGSCDTYRSYSISKSELNGSGKNEQKGNLMRIIARKVSD